MIEKNGNLFTWSAFLAGPPDRHNNNNYFVLLLRPVEII